MYGPPVQVPVGAREEGHLWRAVSYYTFPSLSIYPSTHAPTYPRDIWWMWHLARCCGYPLPAANPPVLFVSKCNFWKVCFLSLLKSQNNCWHLLTFCNSSSLLVGFEINFFLSWHKDPKYDFFPHGNRRWGGSRSCNLPKRGILYLNSILIHDYTAGQIVFLQQNVAVAFLQFTSAIITLGGAAWLMGRKDGRKERKTETEKEKSILDGEQIKAGIKEIK